MSEIVIDGIKISPNHPTYVIAELSANHNGRLQKVLDTITKVNLAQLFNEEIMGSIL